MGQEFKTFCLGGGGGGGLGEKSSLGRLLQYILFVTYRIPNKRIREK